MMRLKPVLDVLDEPVVDVFAYLLYNNNNTYGY